MIANAPESILVINAGSSTIKYAVYNADDLSVLERKTIEIKSKDGYEAAFKRILKLVDSNNIVGVGHRVVHGGRKYAEPQRIDADVLAELEDLTPLAPLHQPYNLGTVKLIMDKYPDLPQTACFDTAFHQTRPRINQLFPIPRAMTDEGIIRYGFHGSSYEYIASVLPQYAGETAKDRVIVAHLGSGASLCAMKDGKSVSTTMGLTALGGMMMGTRTGDLDPGVPLHLIEQKGMSPEEVSELLSKQSGLKGVSGLTGDMRDLEKSDTTEAAEAIDLFCLTAAKQIASLTVDIGGLDALVFTAGIGENSPNIRQKICGHLQHLGVTMDFDKNKVSNSDLHTDNSAVQVYVIKTNEELMMAQHVKAKLQSDLSVVTRSACAV